MIRIRIRMNIFWQPSCQSKIELWLILKKTFCEYHVDINRKSNQAGSQALRSSKSNKNNAWDRSNLTGSDLDFSLEWQWGHRYCRLPRPSRLTFGSHGRIHPLDHVSLCLHLVFSQTAERPCRSTQKHRKRGKVIKGVQSPHRHNSKQLEHHLRHQCPTGSASRDSTGFYWRCCHAFLMCLTLWREFQMIFMSSVRNDSEYEFSFQKQKIGSPWQRSSPWILCWYSWRSAGPFCWRYTVPLLVSLQHEPWVPRRR